MIECGKIEQLLWDFAEGILSEGDISLVNKHLDECVICRQSLATVRLLIQSKEIDKNQISAINSDNFDNSVMNKIQAQKHLLSSELKDTRYIARMSLSIVLAAAIVIFMLLSISDIQDIPSKKRGAKAPSKAEDNYGMINIELKKGTDYDKNIHASAEKSQKESAPRETFSIITGPIANPSPDSVNIEAVYLSEETVPIFSQQLRASLREIVIDSATVDPIQTPIPMLVTVEKMPTPIQIITPEYPVFAQKRGISGSVWIKAHIGVNGDVDNAIIISSTNPGSGFENAALEAALNSKYIPAESNGLKIPVWIIYSVKFIYKK